MKLSCSCARQSSEQWYEMFFLRSEWSWAQSRVGDRRGDRTAWSDGLWSRTELSNWQGKYCRCRPVVASMWTRSGPSSPILWETGTTYEVPVSRKTRASSSSNKMPRGSCCRWPSLDRHAVAILNVYKMKAGPGLGLHDTSIGWSSYGYLGRLKLVSGRSNLRTFDLVVWWWHQF